MTASLLMATVSEATAEERQPNVIILMTDDQGWGDLGFSGRVLRERV